MFFFFRNLNQSCVDDIILVPVDINNIDFSILDIQLVSIKHIFHIFGYPFFLINNAYFKCSIQI